MSDQKMVCNKFVYLLTLRKNALQATTIPWPLQLWNRIRSSFCVYYRDCKQCYKTLFKAIVEIMHQDRKMCALLYKMYVWRIFFKETHFQKHLCTEKARNFREFCWRNRPFPKVRLEYGFLSFLIFEDIQNLKKTIKSSKNEYDRFSNKRDN